MGGNGRNKVIVPIVAFIICGIIIIMERYGVTGKNIGNRFGNDVKLTNAVSSEKTCLVLIDHNEKIQDRVLDMVKNVLGSMKINYDIEEAKKVNYNEELKNYDTVVIGFANWNNIGENLPILCDWIEQGGHLMNVVTPEPNGSFAAVAQKLGVINGGDAYAGITGLHILNNSMIGSENSSNYNFSLSDGEKLYTSLNVALDDDCEKYVESTDGQVPILWTRKCGNGKIAFINDTIIEKYQRAFICLAYSLLDKACIYPVIDASAFYLDDFPAPVPEGDSTYIKRDFGVDTASFYSTIWWPKILKWEKKYGIKHTGVIIENYSDDVKAPFARNRSVTQMIQFGNMLLNNGGELGLHGYNHMPLCVKGRDDSLQFGYYKLWPSVNDMEESVRELNKFASSLFPGESFRVYIPPSNILSETGRKALVDACPSIKIVSSTYLKDSDNIACVQEFGVGRDGIINTPRIVSGCEIDDYQKLSAFAELNFHYVQSHFMHPDDVLDVDRGAKLGWRKLSSDLEKYLTWVYDSAPDIRNVTGSEMGDAVLKYSNVSLIRTFKNNVLTVKIGGFSDEARFLLRINEGHIDRTEGCKCEKVANDLYAVKAVKDEIKIYLGGAE